MLIRVVDLETASFNADDGACEAAWVQIEHDGMQWGITKKVSTLLKPKRPMHKNAIDTHKITEEMVANAIPDTFLNNFIHWNANSDGPYTQENVQFIAAHNISFEEKFIEFRGAQAICTLKCARKIFPGLPNYKNETVFHSTGGVLTEEHHPAHRALPDCMITAHHLIEMLKKYTPHELANMTAGRSVGNVMNYGKYKGCRIDDEKMVPNHYLLWIRDESNMGPQTKLEARAELERRGVK